jgi:hypothetical protein
MPPLSVTEEPAIIDYGDHQCSDTASVSSTTTRLITPKSRRSVSFAPQVDSQQYSLHLKDYTEEEIKATWYTNDEYKMVKLAYRVTVSMVAQGELLPPDQCFRGLEHKTNEGMQARMMSQFHSLSAVMDEQDRQRKEGERDDVHLARIYMSDTAQCMAAAHCMGLNDQRMSLEPIGQAALPQAQPQRRRLSCTAA